MPLTDQKHPIPESVVSLKRADLSCLRVSSHEELPPDPSDHVNDVADDSANGCDSSENDHGIGHRCLKS